MHAGYHFIIFAILFGIAIIDWIMLGNWVRFYYLLGIPLYKRSFTYTRDLSNMALIDKLDNHIISLNQPFGLKEFDRDTVAFREAYKFQMSFGEKKQRGYSPMMHGVIRFDRITRKVTITGIGNWFTFFFIPGFIFLSVFTTVNVEGPFQFIKFIFPIGLFAVYFIIYRMQKGVYDKIVDGIKKIVGGVEY